MSSNDGNPLSLTHKQTAQDNFANDKPVAQEEFVFNGPTGGNALAATVQAFSGSNASMDNVELVNQNHGAAALVGANTAFLDITNQLQFATHTTPDESSLLNSVEGKLDKMKKPPLVMIRNGCQLLCCLCHSQCTQKKIMQT